MKASKAFLITLAAGIISCGLFAQQASAQSITGDIDFSGNVSFNTGDLATATSVTQFRDVGGMAGFLNVSGTSGSFTAIPLSTDAAFTTPYVFSPSTPYNPLWTVTSGGTTFSFQLLSSTIQSQSATFLNVTGAGILTGTGFAPTPGMWSFTSTTSAGGRTDNKFGFAANTSAVPDGGSALALLGISLVGIQVLRRKLSATA